MPTVASIIRSTESVTAAKGASFTIAIGAEVEIGASIVMHSASVPSGTSRDFRYLCTVELEASGGATPGYYDTIRVRRNSSASAVTFDLAWEVIEFDAASLGPNGVTWGRDSGFSAGGTVSKTIAVSDVDSAVCILSWSTSSFSIALSDGSVRASITSTTNLDLICSAAFAGSLEVVWQVIDFDASDVSVQRGDIPVTALSGANTATATDTISSVDTDATLVIGNGITFPSITSVGAIRFAMGLQLTDATTVTAFLGGYGSESGKVATIGYEIAEFLDGAAVESGTLAFGSSDSSKTSATFSPALDADRTACWRVHADLGNVDTNNTALGGTGAATFRQALDITTDVDSVTAYRNVTGQAVDTWYQAIEFAAAGGGGGGGNPWNYYAQAA